jgi:hypothetical protein
MNHLDRSQETREAPEAAHGRSDLQKELAEVLRQREAISAVLRAIANSPHELQPIFDAILDSATRLCRAEVGVFRLVEDFTVRVGTPARTLSDQHRPSARTLTRDCAGQSRHIPKKMHEWKITRLLAKAEFYVETPDEKGAIEAAVKLFQIAPQLQNRLVAQRVSR